MYIIRTCHNTVDAPQKSVIRRCNKTIGCATKGEGSIQLLAGEVDLNSFN